MKYHLTICAFASVFKGKNLRTGKLQCLILKLSGFNGDLLQKVCKSVFKRDYTGTIPPAPSEPADVVENYDPRANIYLRNPAGFDQLSETVGQRGVYWLSLNES